MFIRVVWASKFPSRLSLNNIPLCMLYCILFISFSVSGHLGCFCLLIIMNNAAVNMGIQISLWDPVFNSFGYKPGSEIVESYVLLLGRKVVTNLDCILKSRHYFVNKGPSSQSCGFSSSLVWMWELGYKESWVPKNWCFWNCGVGEDSWESLGLQGDPTSPS